MSGFPLYVRAEGLVCALGGTVDPVASAILARTSAVARHPIFIGTDGLAQQGGWVEGCRDERDTARRLGYLLRGAIAAAVGSAAALELRRANDGAKLPLMLGLPTTVSHPGPVRESVKAELDAALAEFELSTCTIVHADHAAGFHALKSAADAVASREHAAVLVVGVDSLCAPVILDYLAFTGRARQQADPYAAIPGEAAAALLVTARADAGPAALARIDGVELGAEEQRLDDPKRGVLGRALGVCVRVALGGAAAGAAPRVAKVITDQTGERYRAEDYGGAISSLDTVDEAFLEPLCPAASIGDVGAAYGPLALILARHALREPGERALVTAATRDGARGAATISLPERAPRRV